MLLLQSRYDSVEKSLYFTLKEPFLTLNVNEIKLVSPVCLIC